MHNNYNVDVRTVDRSTLRDIGNVQLNEELSKTDKMKSYVEQIGNPYCYLDNNMVVKISFTDTEATLEDRLKSYICTLG